MFTDNNYGYSIEENLRNDLDMYTKYINLIQPKWTKTNSLRYLCEINYLMKMIKCKMEELLQHRKKLQMIKIQNGVFIKKTHTIKLKKIGINPKELNPLSCVIEERQKTKISDTQFYRKYFCGMFKKT